MNEKYIKILLKNNVPENIISHSIGVFKIADFLCKKIKNKGFEINQKAVIEASFLHDIDKIYSDIKSHGLKARKILKNENLDPLTLEIIENHAALNIFKKDFFKNSLEIKLVFYADKIYADSFCSLKERVLMWQRNHNLKDEDIFKTLKLMEKIEKDILDKAGIKFKQLKIIFIK